MRQPEVHESDRNKTRRPEDQPAGPVVEVVDVSKSYGGAKALDGVTLQLFASEVHAVLGENGAGKSTLVKILTGVIQPDDGHILIDGEERKLPTPLASRRAGIAAMFQEPTIYPDLSIAENIFAGRQPRGFGRTVDWRTMNRRAKQLLADLGVDFPPDALARSLGVADRQLVEIAKALTEQARVLIMDEPTASLSPFEVDRLFTLVGRLRVEGVALVFVNHRLNEVRQVSDRISVLRDGRLRATAHAGELSDGDVIRLMVGRDIERPERRAPDVGMPALELNGFTRRGFFDDVTLCVHHGEIVGLAGIVGAGRSEIARSVFGIDPVDAGSVRIDGAPFTPSSPRGAMRRGIAYVPEDRLSQGLVPKMSIRVNTSLAVLPLLTRAGFLRQAAEQRLAVDSIQRLSIRARSAAQTVSTLSGGNQQKVVLAKWLALEPRVLILDEPTRGIDVGTKAQVHEMVVGLARAGLGVLLISSDLPELLTTCDRVVIMREGAIVGEVDPAVAGEEEVVAIATGATAGTLS